MQWSYLGIVGTMPGGFRPDGDNALLMDSENEEQRYLTCEVHLGRLADSEHEVRQLENCEGDSGGSVDSAHEVARRGTCGGDGWFVDSDSECKVARLTCDSELGSEPDGVTLEDPEYVAGWPNQRARAQYQYTTLRRHQLLPVQPR